MTGTEALQAYGYVQRDDGRFVRPGKNTQQWEAGDEGWTRYDPTPDGYVVMPHSVDAAKAAGRLVDITNPEHHQFCNLVWPDEEVARIYGHAAEQAAAGWPGE